MTRGVTRRAGRGSRAQLALDLPHRPALGRDDFLTAPGNAEAVAWIERWPAWPGPALVLHGPAGCGKTHLASLWQARAGAVAAAAADLEPDGLPGALEGPGAPRAVLIERPDLGIDERALLHLYNQLAASGGHLLMTASAPPARWPLALPDLASRLHAAPAVGIATPDDALLAAVIVKLFADRQVAVDQAVIDVLLARGERSFEAVRRTVARLDATALARGTKVTPALARALLSAEN